ncbi:glycoside hydrolase family protein [Fortiea contorta]|uniref:glycoside hydrolase family 24 protein n=1 Tax=Fortiea contorta TaxID=1892405 RepID=UPI00034D8E76|nr:glycoside hydrolase family protein [Fortiea contorta]
MPKNNNFLLLLVHKITKISVEKTYSLNPAKVLLLKKVKFKWGATIVGILTTVLLIVLWQGFNTRKTSSISDYTPPLAMKEGDPYIRALMRTITASEALDSNPYTLLYGGKHFSDLSRHPNQCITIVSGPHKGECSTAAGRYQILTTTWQEKVKKYHKFSKSLSIAPESFEPQRQDEVVYAWLSDHHAWRADITTLLKQKKLNQVLQILSGTWTSLGYGTENNQVTPLLSQVYQRVLTEELTLTKTREELSKKEAR